MNIIVMRRTASTEEKEALARAYPGVELVFHTTNPQSANDHLANCQSLDARIAFLPHEEPIPNLAMRHGIKHLLFRDGTLFELVRVQPEFAPFIIPTSGACS